MTLTCLLRHDTAIITSLEYNHFALRDHNDLLIGFENLAHFMITVHKFHLTCE